MREINAEKITEVVKKLCIEANCKLPEDVKSCIKDSLKAETFETAKGILNKIVENYIIAENELKQIDFYDYVVVNDDLDNAIDEVREIIVNNRD